MGQAKLRGSFEQRQAEGIAKREAEEQRRRDELAAREAAMTPVQLERRARARSLLNTGLAISAGGIGALGLMNAAKLLRRG